MDQNFHYKLGRVDEKQDMILDKLDAMAASNAALKMDVSELQAFRSRVYGIAAGVSATAGAVAAYISKLIPL